MTDRPPESRSRWPAAKVGFVLIILWLSPSVPPIRSPIRALRSADHAIAGQIVGFPDSAGQIVGTDRG